MPSRLALPSGSVFSSNPPRSCLPLSFTGCKITAALRTGFPLSSLTTEKYNHEVGSLSLSFCAKPILPQRSIAAIAQAKVTLRMVVIVCTQNARCHLLPDDSSTPLGAKTLLQCGSEDLGRDRYRRGHHWAFAVDCSAEARRNRFGRRAGRTGPRSFSCCWW